MKQIVDRPLEEIIRSMAFLITSGGVKGQFAKDLEKLILEYKRLKESAK